MTVLMSAGRSVPLGTCNRSATANGMCVKSARESSNKRRRTNAPVAVPVSNQPVLAQASEDDRRGHLEGLGNATCEQPSGVLGKPFEAQGEGKFRAGQVELFLQPGGRNQKESPEEASLVLQFIDLALRQGN